MSPLGLLFLLLVSSCLPVLSVPPVLPEGSSLDEGQLQQKWHENQLRDGTKKFGSWLKNNFRWLGQVIVAGVGSVPVVGSHIAGAVNTILLLVPDADPLGVVRTELKALDIKLDTFSAEMKWDAWAAAAYQIPVNNIEKAWIKYTELVRSYQKSTNTEKEELKNNFVTFYSQYADSTLVLHRYLTAKSVSITQKLGDLLADKLRCHEKEIKAQFLYLNEVMCKGQMLNEKYYEFKGTSANNDRVMSAHKIASQSATALTASHKRCISDSDAYIEKDIFEHIDDTKKHQEIADSVRAFLVKTYVRYDWMVVAFTTHNSRHNAKFLKRHSLLGFTQVERGTVTVAVAKQVKGLHTRTAAVKEAINNCLPTGVKICVDVVKKLMECPETVFGKRLSQTYTAVHAFRTSSHTSPNAVKAPDDKDSLPESVVSPSDKTPYLFTGKCGKVLGKFTVFIKSDEEVMGDQSNLCSKVNCGQNGKCVVVSGTFIAMCECLYPNYGERCEKSLESYKRQLQQGTEIRTQTPERVRKSKSVPPANRRSRQSTSRITKNRRSRKITPRGPNNRKSRKSTSRSPTNRKSRKSTSRSPTNRKSRKSTSRSANNRKSRKSISRSTNNRKVKSRKNTSQGSADRRSRHHLTRGRLNSGSGQRTPGNSAQGRDIKSFCGSLCVDKTTTDLLMAL